MFKTIIGFPNRVTYNKDKRVKNKLLIVCPIENLSQKLETHKNFSTETFSIYTTFYSGFF